MLFLKNIFVILHIITAAAWFGLGLRLGAKARSILMLDRPIAAALVDDTQRTVRFMSIFIGLTLLFSLGAFFLGGGFGGYGPQYHTSLLLIIVLSAVQVGVIEPAWRGMRGAIAGEPDVGSAESYRKRIAISVGIGHLIWLAVLVLMYWTQLAVAFRASF
ncbi:MAG: hypothetical protein GVY18_06385 [Bacteroidetes bacterium]|nr:hypothetical protein [Bacteroidota bacterium]